MREYNLLQDLPESKEPRLVSSTTRTIKNRIIATERDKEFYDGDRNNGFGGYYYDGRWKPVAQRILDEYSPKSILQIGSDKGFLLHELKELDSNLKLRGIEISNYAMHHSFHTVYSDIRYAPRGSFTCIPTPSSSYEFIIAIGAVYSLNLADAIKCLREIQRVGKGKSFITLGAFETEQEERLFKQWSLLGATILHKNDWIEVLKYSGYTGDYWFSTAKTLNLVEG